MTVRWIRWQDFLDRVRLIATKFGLGDRHMPLMTFGLYKGDKSYESFVIF
jgi:hypothetical protein